MTDFALVAHAQIWPNACCLCASQKGPLVDTRHEAPGLGRMYVCKLCAQLLARVMGLVEGERMDELMQAAAGIEEAERQVEIRNTWLAEREEKLVNVHDILATRERELEAERGRIAVLLAIGRTITDTAKQLETQLAEVDGSRPVVEPEPEPEPEPVVLPETVGVATDSTAAETADDIEWPA